MQDLFSASRLIGARLLALSLALAFGMQIWPMAEGPAPMAHAHEAVAQVIEHSGDALDYADAEQELCKQHCLAVVGLVPVAPALPAPGYGAGKDRLADLVPGPSERPQPAAPPPKPLMV